VVVYFFFVPSTLFEEPYSTVIESRGKVFCLNKMNGQWRFPDKIAFENSESALLVLRRTLLSAMFMLPASEPNENMKNQFPEMNLLNNSDRYLGTMLRHWARR
jgi:hypothetical protein